MALPVPRLRLMLAKFAAVVAVTLLTGLMNLAATTVTMYALQLESILFGEQGVTLSLVFRLLLVLVAFALFFSSMLLVITSSARSFKEAQAYLIPLLLISIAPGMVILLPGWQLNLATAVMPMVNMLLMGRAIFEGTASLVPSFVAVVSTVLYATVFLSIAARVFGNEAVNTGSAGQWSDLLERPAQGKPVPEIGWALFLLATLFPTHFVASGLMSRVAESSIVFTSDHGRCPHTRPFRRDPLRVRSLATR